jgi:two-component system, sensor histidine kinase LadS
MRIILLINFLLLSNGNFSQATNGIKFHAAYFKDQNSELNLTNLNLMNFIAFEKGQNINIGYNKNAAIWCYFTLKNTLKSPQTTWLCFDNNHLDSLQLFLHQKALVLGDRTAQNSPFSTTLAYKIDLKPQEEKKFFVRLKKVISFMDFTCQIRSEKELSESSLKNIFLVSFLLGMIILMILFNLILFYISKKKHIILYISYSFLAGCYVLTASGLAKYFVLPHFLFFSELRIYIASLWFINFSLFIAQFLALKESQKIKYRIILFLNGLTLLTILFSIILLIIKNYDYSNYFSLVGHFNFIGVVIGYINFIGLIVLIVWSAVNNLKINKPNSIYVLLAFLPNIVWATSYILKAFKLISNDFHTDWLVAILIYELLLFGYVLTRNYFEEFRKNNTLRKDIIHQKELTVTTVTTAQIKERMQIANIIHDNFGSKLSHIAHLIELEKYALVKKNVNDISKELRNLSHQIIPKALDEGALHSSLQTEINNLNEGDTDCKIILNSYDFPYYLEQQLAYKMYLISLELISNATKHANPSEIIVELFAYDDSLVFQFTDDGIGFNTAELKKGFGISTIESRILAMSGLFEITSKKNEGTIIQITLPK